MSEHNGPSAERWQGYSNGWIGCGDDPQFKLAIPENAAIVAAEHNALLDYAEAERVRANEAEADLRVLREGIKALADNWDSAVPVGQEDYREPTRAALAALLETLEGEPVE